MAKNPKNKDIPSEDIEYMCEFICREFGHGQSKTFQIEHETLAKLFDKKELSQKDYQNFLMEMNNHSYVCIAHQSILFIHYSLLGSIAFIDDYLIEMFKESKINNEYGCSLDVNSNSRGHLH
jgi:hypothetical protein